jgi:hypothetical protein
MLLFAVFANNRNGMRNILNAHTINRDLTRINAVLHIFHLNFIYFVQGQATYERLSARLEAAGNSALSSFAV